MTRKLYCSLALVLAFVQAASSLTLTGTIRDMSVNHPDFEYVVEAEKGIVKPDLGADKKPIYNGNPTTRTTTGKTNFDQWYRDVPGVNQAMPYSIELTDPDGDGIYSYTNHYFFPIDGMLNGNEGYLHNYHFTYEIHSVFTYEEKQKFTFSGDDDVWVFINNELVIDLGGVHTTMEDTIDLDTLGLTPGNTYNFDFFFAERHTSESNFKIETSIELKPAPEPPKCFRPTRYLN